jgi:4,5-dihydroxyphthalate decarboxylase
LSSRPITVAVGDYDRTRELLNGAVGVPGFDARFITGDLEEMFAKAFGPADHEVTEISFSNYLISTLRGECAYVALPLFPSRSFRHSAIYVRPGSGIASPRDLAGKRIGTREYSNTLSLVARGILADEYGFAPQDSQWIVGDVDHVERESIDSRNWPDNGVSIVGLPGKPLSTLMAEGGLDALIAYTPPAGFGGPGAPQRLFPDWRSAEQDYFRRTRRFPIMHVMGIRKDVLEANPTLPAALMQAFEAAKAHALAQLAVHQALPVMLPWTTAETEATQALMGADFWPQGIEANRDMLASQVRWSFEQGLIARQPSLDELFVAS